MTDCAAELCPYWTGQGCACDVLGLPRPEDEVPQRTRDAESRREMRRLLDASSFGTPGAQVMRGRAGRDTPLTPHEEAAVDAEMSDLERELKGWRR